MVLYGEDLHVSLQMGLRKILDGDPGELLPVVFENIEQSSEYRCAQIKVLVTEPLPCQYVLQVLRELGRKHVYIVLGDKTRCIQSIKATSLSCTPP